MPIIAMHRKKFHCGGG